EPDRIYSAHDMRDEALVEEIKLAHEKGRPVLIGTLDVKASELLAKQMAGAGVDIRLGGSDEKDRDEVVELGGLFVIGSGRHDSRRVDDQLRGRAGRQGDPGE